jgi:hypothetical protein
MRSQKYETYVGPSSGYPQPGVFYLDPATTHVLDQELIEPVTRSGGYVEFPSYAKYARLVLDHPAEMAAAYGRRLFNGLDVQYPTPYIRDLGDRSIVLSLLEYTLGAIRWAGVVVLILPCATAVTGAVEPRFFLPIQVLVYMLVCFGPATRLSLLGGGAGRRVGLALSYAAFLGVCLTLSSATLAQLEHPGPTLGGGPSVKSE